MACTEGSRQLILWLVRRESAHLMKRSFLGITCLFLTLSAVAVAAPRSWDAASAASEAERDFAARRVQFYWHGTRGSYPVGVPEEHFQLARRYPQRDAGVGCIVEDAALRARQKGFAERYNAKMLSFILQKRGATREMVARNV